MKLWRKISLWCLIVANLFVMASCSGGPKEVKEGRKLIDSAFKELKDGNVVDSLEYFEPGARQELNNTSFKLLYLFPENVENYQEVLKDFLKDAKITYKDYEYYEEEDEYVLNYTYKGKDLEHFLTTLSQVFVSDIINSPLPDIFGEIIGIPSDFQEDLIEIFGVEPAPGVDFSTIWPIIREAGNTYIDMTKVNFRNLEDIETEFSIAVKRLEDGTLKLY